MLQWEKDSYFEDLLKDTLKFTNKQKAQFAWICTVRSLPLLSVKNFKQWKPSKVPEILWLLFSAIDLCAARLLDLDFDYNSIFMTDLFYLDKYTENDARYYVENITDYYGANSVYGAAYVVQAVLSLAELCSNYDNKYDTTKQFVNQRLTNAAYSVKTAFEKVFIEHKSYLVHDFLNIFDRDNGRIMRNETNGFDNGLSIYDNYWGLFQQDLYKVGLGDWAEVYDNLFSNHLIINKTGLIKRVNDHVQRMNGDMRQGRLEEGEFYGYPRWKAYPS